MPPDVEGTPAAAAATEPNGGAAGAPPAGTEQLVPMSRFKEVSGKLGEATTKLQAYETELGTLRATAQQATTYREQAEAAARKYDSHMAIGRALGGIPDPDVVDLIADRFERLPEADRAEGMAPVLEAWRSDPSKAPPSVRPHFTPPPDAARNATAGAPPPPPARPPVDPHKNAVQTPNPAQGNITAEQIYAMSPGEYLQYSNAKRVALGLPPHPTKT